VEDDRDQLETVPRLLERLGYRVTSCSDAMSAVDAVSSRSEGFDLVVTDFDMPGTDGIELARILYEMEPDLPVILVSGRERAAGKNGAENIRRTMLKPYNGQDLSEIIRRVMSEEGVSRAEGGA
jgi:DNA-binding NtrC family response regulator